MNLNLGSRYVVAGALLFAALIIVAVWYLLEPCRLRTKLSEKFREANLRIDIIVQQSGKRVPWYVIEEGGLYCTQIFGTEKNARWCMIRPIVPSRMPRPAYQSLNLPIVTDANGIATLWLTVDPDPTVEHALRDKIEVFIRPASLVANQLLKYHQAPRLLDDDHWEVTFDIPST